jgi:hypothetical protein
VLRSCTSVDRRDGGSAGGPLVAACAWAGAKIDSKKNREKLTVLNTFAFSIFTPRSGAPNGAPPSYSELGRCLGTHWAELRYVYSESARMRREGSRPISHNCRSYCGNTVANAQLPATQGHSQPSCWPCKQPSQRPL